MRGTSVRSVRIVAVCVVVALAVTGCGNRKTAGGTSPTTSAGNATPTTNVPPTATEIGISPTTIRIAVLADVQNPILPGLFKGSKDAIQAFGEYVNAHGGIAGRKLVVDFVDTGLD